MHCRPPYLHNFDSDVFQITIRLTITVTVDGCITEGIQVMTVFTVVSGMLFFTSEEAPPSG